MNATAPSPAAPIRPRSAWSAWRLALMIAGSLVVLAGAAMLAGGGASAILHLTQRDDDGFLTSRQEQVSSDGYA